MGGPVPQLNKKQIQPENNGNEKKIDHTSSYANHKINYDFQKKTTHNWQLFTTPSSP